MLVVICLPSLKVYKVHNNTFVYYAVFPEEFNKTRIEIYCGNADCQNGDGKGKAVR